MEKFNIDNILQLTELNSELDCERATSLYGKLRWMEKDDTSLKPIRKYLRTLINDYEQKAWLETDKISNHQIEESDKAEELVFAENSFIQHRKKKIVEKLKKYGLTQQDLAKILGHRKNYISELVNGIRPFSRDDLVVIHRLLKIELKYLIPPFIKAEMTKHINLTLKGLKKTKLKLKKKDVDSITI